MPTPPEIKIVHEFDLVLSNGTAMALTLEPELGDTVVETAETMVFALQPRVPFPEATTTTPCEHVVVYKRHLMAVQSRVREIKAGQVADWTKYLPEFTDLPAQ